MHTGIRPNFPLKLCQLSCRLYTQPLRASRLELYRRSAAIWFNYCWRSALVDVALAANLGTSPRIPASFPLASPDYLVISRRHREAGSGQENAVNYERSHEVNTLRGSEDNYASTRAGRGNIPMPSAHRHARTVCKPRDSTTFHTARSMIPESLCTRLPRKLLPRLV